MDERGTRATPENRGAEAAAAYRGERAQARAPRSRERKVFELEDYLLAAWILVVEEAVRRWSGDPFTLMAEVGGSVQGSIGWLEWLSNLSFAAWVVIALFLFVLLTRGPEDTTRDVAIDRRMPMLAFATPVLSMYALVASGIRHLVTERPSGEDPVDPPWPGPAVPRIVRRTAAVPLAFLGDAVFREQVTRAGLADVTMSSLADGISVSMLLETAASAFPFMVFVAGPRIAAGAVLAWRPWIIRFGLFYAALWARGAGLTP